MLTPADDLHHINKHNYKVPFVCGCRDLGEALRRISEGAAMIRTKASHTVLAAAHQIFVKAGIMLDSDGCLLAVFVSAALTCSCHLHLPRLQGEAGTGNVVEAVRHTRAVTGAIRQLQTLDDDELYVYAKELRAPVELVRRTKHLGR